MRLFNKQKKQKDLLQRATRLANPTSKQPRDTTVLVAVIASITSIAAVALNFWLIEGVRTDLAKQTVTMTKQTLELEKVKVDLAGAAQRTAETNALTNQAQLALLVRSTNNGEQTERSKVLLQERITRTGEAGLTQDFTKLISDLRPGIIVTCNSNHENSNQFSANCTFENYGAFLTSVKRKSIEAYDRRGVTLFPNAVKSLVGSDANVIPSKGKGSNTYYFELSDEAIKAGVQLRFHFTADTDKHAIALTKKLSKGIFTDADLKSVTTQGYTFNALVKL